VRRERASTSQPSPADAFSSIFPSYLHQLICLSSGECWHQGASQRADQVLQLAQRQFVLENPRAPNFIAVSAAAAALLAASSENTPSLLLL